MEMIHLKQNLMGLVQIEKVATHLSTKTVIFVGIRFVNINHYAKMLC